jgi:hypothetical protein
LPSTSSAYEPAEESASDDELDNWEPTEASIVVVAGEVSETSFEDDQSRTEPEVEVVEMPEPASKPTQLKQWTAPTQLHTPPHSHSSIDQPITGCLDIPLSDPPSSPRQPRNPPARRRTRSVSVSPKKSQTQAPKAKALAPPQIQVPEILEITDDEEPELGLSRTVPPISPYPPLLSSLPPIVRARSQALSIIPQVVITTLPSHLKHTKTGSESPSSKPSQGFPTKSTKKSVISEALSKIGSPTKTPNKSTFLKPSPKTSPTKKTTQTPKYPQPAKKAEKRTESKTKTTLCRAQSISHEEDRDSLVDDALSTIPRELSPELGETPVLASKGSAVLRASNSPPRTRKSQKRKRSSSPHDSHTLAQGFENDLQERATSGSRGTTTGEGLLIYFYRTMSYLHQSERVMFPALRQRGLRENQDVLLHPRTAKIQALMKTWPIAPAMHLDVLPPSRPLQTFSQATHMPARLTLLECILPWPITGPSRSLPQLCSNSQHCFGHHQHILVQLLRCTPIHQHIIDTRLLDQT